MELKNDFHVSVPIDVAWAVLTDLERIAPCMPGAELQEVEGDEYRGVVKVKVGPISAQYKGVARFVERNDEQHRAVLLAEGRDTRGQGNASATVTALAVPDDDGTTISITTDLTITGKVAQFGRSAMGEISAKMLTEFAEKLEADVLSQTSASETTEPASTEPAPGPASATEAGSQVPDPPSVRKIPSALCDLLNSSDESPFRGMIRRPSASKDKAKSAVVTDTSLIEALKESLTSASGCLFPYRNLSSGETDFTGIWSAVVLYWSAVKNTFPDAWGKPPEHSRLMHGAGIRAMGRLMDRIMGSVDARQHGAADLVAADLALLAPHCHWTEGQWDGLGLRWNEVQNVSQHTRELSSFLMRTYLQARAAQA